MNDVFESLRNNLIRFYIFYVPSMYKEVILNTSFHSMIQATDYDAIGYLNKEIQPSAGMPDSITLDMIKKEQILEQNIFLLFQNKKSLHPNEFSFLIDKYLKNLNSYDLIAQWLNSNLATSIPNVKADEKHIFELQAHLFNLHTKEIYQNFGFLDIPPVINETDILHHFDTSFETDYKQLKAPSSGDLKISQAKPAIKPKKEKKILVTDEEADAFLLESVFNVKITENL